MTPRRTSMTAEMAVNVRPLPLPLPSHHVSFPNNCSFIRIFSLSFHLIIINIFSLPLPPSSPTSLAPPSITCSPCIQQLLSFPSSTLSRLPPSLYPHSRYCHLLHPIILLRHARHFHQLATPVNRMDAMNIF